MSIFNLGYLLIFLIFIFFFFTGVADIGWAPTKRKDYPRIAQLFNPRPGMVFYDLGSGTADLLFYLANHYKITCVGIEVSPFFYLYSKIKSLFCQNVKIKYGNFFKFNLKEADVIYFFLHPKLYPRLKEKILSEAKDGAIIIAAVWPLPDANPIKISQKEKEASYFVYKKQKKSL